MRNTRQMRGGRRAHAMNQFFTEARSWAKTHDVGGRSRAKTRDAGPLRRRTARQRPPWWSHAPRRTPRTGPTR